MRAVNQYYRALNRNVAPTTLPFISTWRTTNTSAGSSASNQVKLPTISSGTYAFDIDWGDGNTDLGINAWDDTLLTHTYASSGDYNITISGFVEGWQFGNTGDRLKILDISQWGDIRFQSNSSSGSGVFFGCSNLNVTALDSPVLLGDLSAFFRACTALVGNSSFNSWDVSFSTNFNSMFLSCINFNQNIGGWNMGNAINLSGMFRASGFNNGGNASINNWDVSSVTSFGGNTAGMFSICPFNQPIGDWDVSSGTVFQQMFQSNSVFNQNIGGWNVSNGTLFLQMFSLSTAFNQNIGGWNVSNGTSFTNFMQGKTPSTFSATNLDAIYNGWSSRAVNPSMSISFGTAKYTAASSAGRVILTGSPNNWTITDGGI